MSKLIFLPVKKEPLRAISSPLAGGKQGNLQTVEFMREVAWNRSRLPEIREAALRILASSGCQSHDRVCEALAIGRFVQANVRYVKDPLGVELLTDPVTLLDQISQGTAQGDCDDMSLLIATLLLSIGIRSKFRMARYTGKRGPFQHIYVVVYESNAHRVRRRVVLDAILKDQPIGTEVAQESGEERAV